MITNSIKLSFFAAAVLASAFMVVAINPPEAAAASVTNVEYSNGDVTIQGNGGQSVSGKVRVVVGNNEEVEFVEFDVISDNLAPHCKDVGRLQEGTHFVDIEGVKFPPNTGTYSLNTTVHGIFGGLAADDCEGDQVGSASFGSSVRTVGGNSGNTGSSSLIEQLQQQIADLLKMISDLKNPAKPAYCAQMSAHTAWYGQSGASVTAYQHFLIANGFSIPAGATGYFGNQTQAAATAMAAACR